MKKFITNNCIIFGMYLFPNLVAGFLNGAGLATSKSAGTAIFAITQLATIAGFCIAGCRIPSRRIRHLCWLAAFFWAVNGLFCVAMNLPDSESIGEWLVDFLLLEVALGNLFFTAFCAGIGGVFSMAIMEHLDKQKGKTA